MFVTECFQVIVWIQKFKVSPTGATYLHIKTFTLGKTLSSHTRFHLHSTFKLKGILVLQHKAPFTVFNHKLNILEVITSPLGVLDREPAFKNLTLSQPPCPHPPLGSVISSPQSLILCLPLQAALTSLPDSSCLFLIP